MDKSLEHSRRTRNRQKLAAAFTAYFEALSKEGVAEKNSLAESLHSAADEIDSDLEP